MAEARAAAGRNIAEEGASIAVSDSAEPLAAEGFDATLIAGLQERLDALERAARRLEAGTFGVSLLSGAPISDERLEANPAAETTVEESTRR